MEAIGIAACKDQTQIMKGKRTKRPRLPSPLRLSMPSTSSSSTPGRSSHDENSGGVVIEMPTTSTTHEFLRETTEEEEDMANCLILLAQGHISLKSSYNTTTNKASSEQYLYQCKTCDRCFPSFQALGGHRASHKKPKPVPEPKMEAVGSANEHGDRYDRCDRYDPTASTALSLQISNRASYSSTGNKSKVHECSICGAEFSSGQALGGHMRRHRTIANTCATSTSVSNVVGGNSESQEAKKPRNVLKLDLNLPAPEDDQRESKFSFQSKDNVLVFSASSLVDCHY